MGNDITGGKMIKRKRKRLRAVQDASAEHAPPTGPKLPLTGGAAFQVGRERLSQMREADPTLWECFAKVMVVPAQCHQHVMSVAHEN
ncbi:hypothetical protein JOB18_046471 [Solea senegalensis]|uniref:Uncharacterized protein n=1 Tax=Solea senegalensis TaxID=28829 RepID=A0AAV6RNK6_SOLSE|nr:hypothetical protein JOB18_046471 [Solea senegalensis]